MTFLTVRSISRSSQGRVLPFKVLPAVAATPPTGGVRAIFSKMADCRGSSVYPFNSLVSFRFTDLHYIAYTLLPLQIAVRCSPLPCGLAFCAYLAGRSSEVGDSIRIFMSAATRRLTCNYGIRFRPPAYGPGRSHESDALARRSLRT
jgi:hypothetical protein